MAGTGARVRYRPPTGSGATSPKLLANEGAVGPFGRLNKNVGKKGDNITAHHIPSDTYMKAKVPGYTRDEGIAIMMEQPSPGVGGRHRRTLSYGTSPDLTRTPKQALIEEVLDARQRYIEDGLFTPEIEEALIDVIRQNLMKYPQAFSK